ncbi:hypothetical protein C9F11_45935 (plasmid) [Streptomyces sp. YIM 121038]|nr:hypothetical protein C9F11_45935 [Streptomyces sp. YIM 121038]
MSGCWPRFSSRSRGVPDAVWTHRTCIRPTRRCRCPGDAIPICFEDEAGFTRRPPRGRTWGRRGITPVVTVSGRRSGRLSVAGLIAWRPGSRTWLCHRPLRHPAGKGQRRSMSERDCIALPDGVHQLVKAPLVLVWDRLNTHVSKTMRQLISGRAWLTVFLLLAYSPQLDPVQMGVGAYQTEPGQPRRCHSRPSRGTRPQPAQTSPVPPRHPQRIHSRNRPAPGYPHITLTRRDQYRPSPRRTRTGRRRARRGRRPPGGGR